MIIILLNLFDEMDFHEKNVNRVEIIIGLLKMILFVENRHAMQVLKL